MLNVKKLIAKLLNSMSEVTEYEETIIHGNYIPSGGWIIKRTGSTVFLFLTSITSAPAGAFGIDAVIPESMRPSPFANKTIQPRTGSARPPIAVGCNANGSISFYNYGTAITGTANINETISWTVL